SQAEDGIRGDLVTGVQTCALPICTVNKERARAGEAKQSSRLSRTDISSGRRGGLRSHQGPGGRTYDQLYEEAKDRGVKGRSKMRSEERRVGREWRGGRWAEHKKAK